jgi:hypothetical protein
MLSNQKVKDYFYRYYGLFYLLFFVLIGVIVWLLLSGKPSSILDARITKAEERLQNCDCNCNDIVDTIHYKSIGDTSTHESPPNIKPCESKIKSGDQGVDKGYVQLGQYSGRVTINYDMLDQPDKLEVFYENKRVVSTFEVRNNVNGFVGNDNRAGGVGVLSFDYIYNVDDFVKIVVTAPNSGTKWAYSISCPE